MEPDALHWLADSPTLPDRVHASRRAADAARRVIDGLAGTRADPATLDEISAVLNRLANVLGDHDPKSRYAGVDASSPRLANPEIRELHPTMGESHPFAPPIRFLDWGDPVVAEAVFSHAYEGPPEHLHGGFVAAAFDTVLGVAAAAAQMPMVTGTLSVRYRASTPLDRVIRFEAWVDRADARKVLTAGRSTCDDRVLADATAVFVRVPDGRSADRED